MPLDDARALLKKEAELKIPNEQRSGHTSPLAGA